MFLLSETNEELSMQINENRIKFSLGKIKFISKVIDGKFPDYKKVVPTNNQKNFTFHQKNSLILLRELLVFHWIERRS